VISNTLNHRVGVAISSASSSAAVTETRERSRAGRTRELCEHLPKRITLPQL
jgi:hypothetical protein